MTYKIPFCNWKHIINTCGSFLLQLFTQAISFWFFADSFCNRHYIGKNQSKNRDLIIINHFCMFARHKMCVFRFVELIFFCFIHSIKKAYKICNSWKIWISFANGQQITNQFYNIILIHYPDTHIRLSLTSILSMCYLLNIDLLIIFILIAR